MAETQTGNGQTAAAARKKAREVEKVRMEDGREVEFVGKSKIQKDSLIGTKSWDELSPEERATSPINQAAIRIDFRNGTTRTYKLNPGLALQYALHGALQKYGDELAGEE